jgi:hypothetical protein
MRRYRIAVALGIISVVLLSLAFILFQASAGELERSRGRLSAIRGESAQLREYHIKIGAIKTQSAQLKFLSREKSINLDYEIELGGNDLSVLMDEMTKSYSGMIVFLEEAAIESREGGITVRVKGFKPGGGNQP